MGGMWGSARSIKGPETDLQEVLGKPDREKELIGILRDKGLQKIDPDKVVHAIRELGDSKSISAIPDLIALLGFRRHYPSDDAKDDVESHPETWTGRYPAGGALFQIGEPAIPALIKVIQNRRCEEIESQVAIEAVRGIFRDKIKEGLDDLRARGSRQAKLAAKPCFVKLIKDMAKRS